MATCLRRVHRLCPRPCSQHAPYPPYTQVGAPARRRGPKERYCESLCKAHDQPQGIFASEIPKLSRVFVDLDVLAECETPRGKASHRSRSPRLGPELELPSELELHAGGRRGLSLRDLLSMGVGNHRRT